MTNDALTTIRELRAMAKRVGARFIPDAQKLSVYRKATKSRSVLDKSKLA